MELTSLWYGGGFIKKITRLEESGLPITLNSVVCYFLTSLQLSVAASSLPKSEFVGLSYLWVVKCLLVWCSYCQSAVKIVRGKGYHSSLCNESSCGSWKRHSPINLRHFDGFHSFPQNKQIGRSSMSNYSFPQSRKIIFKAIKTKSYYTRKNHFRPPLRKDSEMCLIHERFKQGPGVTHKNKGVGRCGFFYLFLK